MKEKIINFKYNNIKNNNKMPSKQPKLKNKYKKFLSKLKYKWNNFTDKLTKLTVRVIAAILNIDVMPVFIFFSSYVITFDFPIVWRAIISITIYQLYKMLVKDIISVVRGRMK